MLAFWWRGSVEEIIRVSPTQQCLINAFYGNLLLPHSLVAVFQVSEVEIVHIEHWDVTVADFDGQGFAFS
jgi:hypothetical protein